MSVGDVVMVCGDSARGVYNCLLFVWTVGGVCFNVQLADVLDTSLSVLQMFKIFQINGI